MLKMEFKDATAVLLIIAAAAIGIAIIGTNPLNPPTALENWARFALGGFGGICIVAIFIISRHSSKQNNLGHTNADYNERFRKTQELIKSIDPENTIIGATIIGSTKFDVINGNILDSRSEVIVSSDDNHFSARGGVAKAILEKCGALVTEELSQYREKNFRQGNIAITTGGDWKCRAIIHPAVIDLDENRYPTIDLIKAIVRGSLNCALALGAQSISFPVLGGGTASKTLKPSESVQTIVNEIIAYLNEHKLDTPSFSYVSLYVWNKDDASSLTPELVTAKK
jgi:O-acetyl-ADP-ribose deacetylase